MKSQIMGLKVAGTLFILVALAHLARLVLGWTVQLGGRYFGMKWSLVAIAVSAALGIWLWMLACCCKADAASTPPKA